MHCGLSPEEVHGRKSARAANDSCKLYGGVIRGDPNTFVLRLFDSFHHLSLLPPLLHFQHEPIRAFFRLPIRRG